jgi:hypothetical protein
MLTFFMSGMNTLHRHRSRHLRGFLAISGAMAHLLRGLACGPLFRCRACAENACHWNVSLASHMEALAHCTQTRQDLRDYIAEKGMSPQRAPVPADGESYRF